MQENQNKGVTAPGTEKRTYEFSVNGHKFTAKKRTFMDQSRIRSYAMNICQMSGADVVQAAAMVDNEGLEFRIAKCAICLSEAPDHWKNESGEIAPELLDFENDVDEFGEVYVEVVSFHNRFRKPGSARKLADRVQKVQKQSSVEDIK